MPFAGLLAGEAGGVRPRGCLLTAGKRTTATGFFAGGFAEVLGCDTLGSVALAVADNLEAALGFTVGAGLEGPGFLVAADVVVDGAVVGFFATVAGGGRLTSNAKTKPTKCDDSFLPPKKTLNYKYFHPRHTIKYSLEYPVREVSPGHNRLNKE